MSTIHNKQERRSSDTYTSVYSGNRRGSYGHNQRSATGGLISKRGFPATVSIGRELPEMAGIIRIQVYPQFHNKRERRTNDTYTFVCAGNHRGSYCHSWQKTTGGLISNCGFSATVSIGRELPEMANPSEMKRGYHKYR
jgi:hypothetical protein